MKSTLQRSATWLLCTAGLLLTPQALWAQYLVASNHVQLTFVDDIITGVSLQSFKDLSGNHTFTCSPPPGKSKSIWSVLGENGSVAVGNNNCTKSPLTVGSMSGYLFSWPDVVMAAQPNVHLKVEVLVMAAPDDRVARWWISVDRVDLPVQPPTPVALMQVTCPNIWLEPLITPVPGETLLQAQARSRLLMPTNVVIEPMTQYPNQNLGLLAEFDRLAEIAAGPGVDNDYIQVLKHPGGQTMQFSAYYVSDPSSAKNRSILYFGTDDRSGHYKTYAYEITAVDPEEGSTDFDLRYGWRHNYFPPFSDVFADPANPPHTRHLNSFVSPYPAVTGLLKAKSDDWWFDVCEYYRGMMVENDSVSGQKLGTARIEANPWLSKLSKASALQSLNFYLPGNTLTSMEVHNAAASLLGSTHVQPKQYYHSHTTASPYFTPTNPPQWFPGFISMIGTAANAGVQCSLYIYGSNVADVLNWGIPHPIAQLRDINGNDPAGCEPVPPPPPVPPVPNCFWSFDAGRPSAPAGEWTAREWLFKVLYEPLRAMVPGINGIYLDSFVGGGAYLGYDHPQLHANEQQHAAHGGNYSTVGRKATLEYWRTGLRAGNTHPDAAMISEGTEEYLHDRLDMTQLGWSWIPNHLLGAEEQTALALFPHLIPAVANVPHAARNLTPPLWQAVYHAYSTAQNIPPMITATPLSTNPDLWEYQSVGLAPQEWEDIHCYTRASNIAAGARAAVLSYFGTKYLNYPAFRLVGGLLVPEPIDSSGTGLTIYSFIKTMHEAEERAYGGQFLMYGDMQRPLQVNLQDPAIHFANNPSQALIAAQLPQGFDQAVGIFPEVAEGGQGTPVSLFQAYGGYSNFNVPKVLQSVWKNPEGEFGIVLINWSGQAASFKGSFDPALYPGLSSTTSYKLQRLSHGGLVLHTFGGMTGAVTIDASATPVGPVNLGLIPPRSVVVLKLATDA
jgi:hypothetical protein